MMSRLISRSSSAGCQEAESAFKGGSGGGRHSLLRRATAASLRQRDLFFEGAANDGFRNLPRFHLGLGEAEAHGEALDEIVRVFIADFGEILDVLEPFGEALDQLSAGFADRLFVRALRGELDQDREAGHAPLQAVYRRLGNHFAELRHRSSSAFAAASPLGLTAPRTFFFRPLLDLYVVVVSSGSPDATHLSENLSFFSKPHGFDPVGAAMRHHR